MTSPRRPVVVAGVLVVHNGAAWLQDCLDGLALQTRPLDRLVVIDTGSADGSLHIVQKHARIRQVVGQLSVLSAPEVSSFGQAVGAAVEHLTMGRESGSGVDDPDALASGGVDWLWLLHDDSAAAPRALAWLLDDARRSPSVGIAGPKLVTWDDPSRLLEVGSLITRSGRRVGGPEPGELDQGQHDNRGDVLGVSTSGMLIRRDVFDTLGGFDPAFRHFRDDLDLCWRAQLAGHRVVVSPRARVREAAATASGQRFPDISAGAARRRARTQGRQVALARCSLSVMPFLAIWIALASLGSAAALLVAKRPHRAWLALGDLGALITPWRPIAARWRSRGLRRVRDRDLRGLFGSAATGVGHAIDTIQEGAVSGNGRSVDDQDVARQERSLESGPVPEDVEPLGRPARRGGWRVLRHPGFLVVTAAAVLAAVSWRSQLVVLTPGGLGIAGGELLPATGDASGLWHAWLDGWHGPGLGSALEQAPYLPVLAAGAWVIEHLPFVGAPASSVGISASPVGVAVAWLLAAAAPLSAWTAYLGARVVTRAPWPRAWAAMAWASLATLNTAVATGRLGAVVTHILLPVVTAGFALAVRRSAHTDVIFGAALALGVVAAFNPSVLAVGAVAAFVLLAYGHWRARLRAAVLLVVPFALLGPWVLRLVDDPILLLSGPGLTVWPGAAAEPWQLGLLPTGGSGSYPLLVSAPIVLAAVIALSRHQVPSGARTVLAVIAAGGLALGMASPQVIISRVPPGLSGAGAPITGWAGTGLDLAALALVAAVLHGVRHGVRQGERHGVRNRARRDQAGSGRSFSWRRLAFPVAVTAAVLGVAAQVVVAGWLGVGGTLGPLVPTVPAVAVDQAHGPLGSRLLLVSMDRDTIGYQLVGAETGPVVRDLPDGSAAPDPVLAAAVNSPLGPTPAGSARDDLADLGVGLVAFQGAPTEPMVRKLDATPGLSRLSNNRDPNNRDPIIWRVLPRGNVAGSSRLWLEDARGGVLGTVPVTGDHARTDVAVGPAGQSPADGQRRLVVAESRSWEAYARVTFQGRPLAPVAGAGQPTYLLPADAGRLSITVPPSQGWWRWWQLGTLAAVLYLAAPFGSIHVGGARRQGARRR